MHLAVFAISVGIVVLAAQDNWLDNFLPLAKIPIMRRKAVSSSMVASVGYDKKTKTLEVEFSSGRVYQYAGVPEKVYRGLLRADSIGRYMDDQVIDCYECWPCGGVVHNESTTPRRRGWHPAFLAAHFFLGR